MEDRWVGDLRMGKFPLFPTGILLRPHAIVNRMYHSLKRIIGLDSSSTTERRRRNTIGSS